MALLEDLDQGQVRRATSDIPIPEGFLPASEDPAAGDDPEAKKRWWKAW